jgi:hypothetical protein
MPCSTTISIVGLPYSAVVYIMQNAPQSITWLSMADAKRLGIELSSLNSGLIVSEAPQSAATPRPPTSSAAMSTLLWQVP